MADGWMVAWWLGGGASIGALGMYLRMDVVMRRARQEHIDQLLNMQTWMTTARPAPASLNPEPPVDPLTTLTNEMIGRLLDAALPKREADVSRDDERPPSPGEYEAPDREVGDWTDPFFGLERGLVGGLRPGEGIPGIGHGERQEYEGNWTSDDESLDGHPFANGFLPDDDAAREGWRDLGGEVFEEWDSRK